MYPNKKEKGEEYREGKVRAVVLTQGALGTAVPPSLKKKKRGESGAGCFVALG